MLPGREREGAYLNELLNRVRGGHSAAIVMHGEAGVGKTALLNEVFGSVPDLDKSSVTGLVDRAERRGLVARVPSTADRRSVLVTLTDHGRSLVSDRAARFEADMSLLLGRLEPADRDALSGLISRLLVAHAADHGIDLFATVDTEIPGAGGRLR